MRKDLDPNSFTSMATYEIIKRNAIIVIIQVTPLQTGTNTMLIFLGIFGKKV